jgi:hypothetical protein
MENLPIMEALELLLVKESKKTISKTRKTSEMGSIETLKV